jgi:hypothetical protein
MRSDKSPEDFLIAVAKKKPRLQAYIDNLQNMSDTDIDTIPEQLWIKQALKKLKHFGSQSDRLKELLDRTIAAEAAAKEIPSKTYEIRIWDCDKQFIGTESDLGRGWKIEVEPGDSFMILEDDLVRFGDSVLKVDEFNRYPLLQFSKFVGYMTLDNYRGFHRVLLNKKHGG